MGEHASTVVTRKVASPVSRRRRWLIGTAGLLGASGLVVGGVGVPVSADGGNVAGTVHTSTEVEDGCATATAGTGGGEESGQTVRSDMSGVHGAGGGTVTASACRDDVDNLTPGDPGGAVPDDPGGVDPGDPGGVNPGDPGGVEPGDPGDVLPEIPGDGGGSEPGGPPDTEVVGAVTEAVEDVLNSGDGTVPGGPADELPGGLVPAAPGTGPVGVLDRVAQVIPELTVAAPGDDVVGAPGGHNGGGQSGNGATAGNGAGTESTSTSADSAVTGAVPAAGDDPMAVGIGAVPGATLPRTGGGLGAGVPGLVALLGAGRAMVALVNRRWPAAGASRG